MVSPYGVSAPNATAAWHPEPQYRGTFGILSTCIITIGLCVWTSPHLNISEQGKPTQQLWRRIGWVVVGIFAPELVAWIAFQQYIVARKTLRQMREVYGQAPPQSNMTTLWRWLRGSKRPHDRTESLELSMDLESNATAQRHIWTMAHSHYVAMGGFAFDISHSSAKNFPTGAARMVLSVHGLTLLSTERPHLIPNLSEAEIRDKSKANAIAKTLVCLQALWFCIQCIHRLASAFPISLLEINTFAHAICALLIYLLWWDKPLDIEEPTIMRGETTDQIAAYLFIDRATSKWWGGRRTEYEGLKQCRSCNVYFSRRDHYDQVTEQIEYEDDRRFEANTENNEENTSASQRDEETHISIRDNENTAASVFESKLAESLQSIPLRPGYQRIFDNEEFHGWHFRDVGKRIEFIDLSPIDLRIFNMAAAGFKELGRKYLLQHIRDHREREWLRRRSRNWPVSDLFTLIFVDNGQDSNLFRFGFMVSGLIYGGLHLTAWRAPFHTLLQQYFWKVSSLYLASSGGVLYLFFIIAEAYQYFREAHDELNEFNLYARIALGISEGLLVIVCLILSLSYIFARAYLVVECFLSIPYLPEDVFRVPEWSQYFPHIS